MNKSDLPELITSRQKPIIIEFLFTLNEEIDIDIMAAAMQKAIRRYPYFAFRIVRTEDGYDKVENPLPLVVLDSWEQDLVLGSKKVNYHWLAAACQGRRLKLLIHHAICDARSAMWFYKTMLYCYISEKYRITLDPSGIFLPDSAVSPGEDMNISEILDDEDGSIRMSTTDPFRLPDKGDAENNSYFYDLTIPVKELMALSKSSDNSPVTLISIFMAKAMQEVWPQNEKSIYAAVAADSRNARHCPESRFNNAYVIFVRHDPDKLEHDLETLGTVTRGQIILQGHESVLRYVNNESLRLSEQMSRAEDPKVKQELAKELYRLYIDDPTYVLSYVGNTELGSLEPYVQEIYTVIVNGRMTIEVNAVKDLFCLGWVQPFENDAYVKAFKKIMDKLGIECRVSEGQVHRRNRCAIS